MFVGTNRGVVSFYLIFIAAHCQQLYANLLNRQIKATAVALYWQDADPEVVVGSQVGPFPHAYSVSQNKFIDETEAKKIGITL